MVTKQIDDPSTRKQLQVRFSCFQAKSFFLQERECAPILQNNQSIVKTNSQAKDKDLQDNSWRIKMINKMQ